MSCQGLAQLLPSNHVPDTDGVIHTPTENELAIWANSHGVDLIGMSLQRLALYGSSAPGCGGRDPAKGNSGQSHIWGLSI